MNSFDASTFREALAGPGSDTRQWLSYGTVVVDTPDARSVRFDKVDEIGPQVIVKLHPSGTVVPCRVSSFVAGQGEGTWYPFVAGDEVLVAIPEGSEMAGCAILGRFNQSLDVWPTTVAGQDATANNFGFVRMRSPFVVETGEGYLIRSAKTGSQIGIDQQGQVIVNDGDQGLMVIGPDAIGFVSGDKTCAMQLLPSVHQAVIVAGDALQAATLTVDASQSSFLSGGSLQVGTGGLAGSGHAVTLEQVLNLLINWTLLLISPTGSSTLKSELTAAGKLFDASAPNLYPASLDAQLVPWLLQAGSPVPSQTFPSVVFGGGLQQFLLTFPLGLTAALAAQLPAADPSNLGLPSIPGTVAPGIGRVSFMY